MIPDDIQKLLGGYATGTLTESERKLLFEAALQDQQLFDAMADEESLRQLLEDEGARAAVLGALQPRPRASWWQAWSRRPAAWATAGSLAAAAALIAVLVVPKTPPPETQIAVARESKVAEAPARAAAEKLQSADSPRQRKQAAPVRELRDAQPTAAPAGPVDERASGAAAPTSQREADAIPKPVSEAVVVSVKPGTVASLFQQTNPPQATDAVELRAEKARAGVGGLSQPMARKAAAPAAPAAPLGIRYSVQQRGAGGSYAPVDPDLPLSAAAPIRLEVESNAAGYLYAFEIGAPNRQLSVGPTVDPHVRHTIDLGEPAGKRKLILVLSSSAIPAFAVGTATEGAAGELDRLRAQAANRQPLRQKSSSSVYVVSAGGTGALSVEVTLPGR